MIKHKIFSVLALLALSLGLATGAGKRVSIEEDWEYTSFSAEGLDPTRFELLKTYIQDGTFRKVDGILVVKSGKILIEEYFNGYDRDKLHEIRSATKSIGSALMGIAIDQEYITGVQDRLYAYFRKREPFQNWEVRKNEITLENVLNMTTGLDCDDMDNSSAGNEDNVLEATDIAQFMLDLPVVYEPGEHWAYGTGSAHLIGAVIESAAGISIQEFAGTYLFEPLNISQYKWKTTGGIAHTGGGFWMLPIDMAKFGQLFLNKGRWHGEKIISEEWIDESSKIHIKVTNDFVELPASSSILTGSPFTISTWIITDIQQGNYGGSEGRIVNLHRGDAYSTSASIYAGGPADGEPGNRDDICFLYWTGNDHKWLCYQTTSPVYHDGNPHLITATHNGSTVKLYYDGVEVRTRNDTFGTFGTATAKIGSFNGSERYFNGIIDEVTTYKRALSADEILAIYIAGSAGKCKVRTVTIDIKPGSYPNSINLGSNGNIPVAIFSTEDFDATTVDPTTITLAGASVRIKGKGTPQASASDVDGDGILDLIVHVDTTAFELTVGDVEAELMGMTFDGKKIRGVDSISIVN
jgi:CubicO group peptidase (beta-lactamase class C family)